MIALIVTGAAILFWLKSTDGLQLKIVNSSFVYHFGKTFIFLSHKLVELFGYDAHVRHFRLENMEYVVALCTPANECLYLAWPCIGVKITAVFIALILVFPGRDLPKLWFIPLGIILIQLFNVIRFSALMMIIYHYPMEVITNFNLWNMGIGYHELFNLALYLVIFALFIIWVNRFGTHQKHS
jgi:exosortase/archaeosortase family protein